MSATIRPTIDAKRAARARQEITVYGRRVQAQILDSATHLVRSVFLIGIRKVRGQDVWMGTEAGTGDEHQIILVQF